MGRGEVQTDSWDGVVAVGAAFLAYGIMTGLVMASGVYVTMVQESFGASLKQATPVSSVPLAIVLLCGPLSAFLFGRLGSRQTVMLAGVVSAAGYFCSYFARDSTQLTLCLAIAGLGLGIVYVPCRSIPAIYFRRYQKVAMAIVPAGAPFMCFALPHLFLLTMDQFSWRGSMFINAGIALQLVVLGALMKSSDCSRKFIDLLQFRMCLDFKLLLFCLTSFCWGGCCGTFYSLINTLAVRHSLSLPESAWVVSICNIVGLLARVSVAFLSQCGLDAFLLYLVMDALISFALIFSSFCFYFWTLASAGALVGLAHGSLVSSGAVVTVILFSDEKLAPALGYVALSSGCGVLLVPIIVGMIADAANIELGFQFAGALNILGTLCSLIIVLWRWMEKRKLRDKSIEMAVMVEKPVEQRS